MKLDYEKIGKAMRDSQYRIFGVRVIAILK